MGRARGGVHRAHSVLQTGSQQNQGDATIPTAIEIVGGQGGGNLNVFTFRFSPLYLKRNQTIGNK